MAEQWHALMQSLDEHLLTVVALEPPLPRVHCPDGMASTHIEYKTHWPSLPQVDLSPYQEHANIDDRWARFEESVTRELGRLPEELAQTWRNYIRVQHMSIIPSFREAAQHRAVEQLNDLLFAAYTFTQIEASAHALETESARTLWDFDQPDTREFDQTVQTRFNDLFAEARAWFDDLVATPQFYAPGVGSSSQQAQAQAHPYEQLYRQQFTVRLHGYFYAFPAPMAASAQEPPPAPKEPMSVFTRNASTFLAELLQLLEFPVPTRLDETTAVLLSADRVRALLRDVFSLQTTTRMRRQERFFDMYYAHVIKPWRETQQQLFARKDARQAQFDRVYQDIYHSARFHDQEYTQAFTAYMNSEPDGPTSGTTIKNSAERLANFVTVYFRSLLSRALGACVDAWLQRVRASADEREWTFVRTVFPTSARVASASPDAGMIGVQALAWSSTSAAATTAPIPETTTAVPPVPTQPATGTNTSTAIASTFTAATTTTTSPARVTPLSSLPTTLQGGRTLRPAQQFPLPAATAGA